MGIVPPSDIPCLSTASIMSTPSLFQPGVCSRFLRRTLGGGPVPPHAVNGQPEPSGAAPAERGQSGASPTPGRPARGTAGPPLSPIPPSIPPSLSLSLPPAARLSGGAGGRAGRDHPAGPRPRHAGPARPPSAAPLCLTPLSSRPLPQAFPPSNRGLLNRKRVQRSPE